MMDIGFMELVLIGVVALIVIGPKDMPEMFRQLGRFTGKLRGMARDFQRAMEQAGDATGAKDIMREVKSATSPATTGMDKLKSAADKFEKWDPIKNAARPTAPPAPRPATGPGAPPVVAVGPGAVPVATAAPAAAATDPATGDPVPAQAGTSAQPATPPSAAPPRGPATQALAEKRAAQAAIAREAAEKMRAVTADPAPDTTP
jgi:sec-independent protein translocase protein TatB